MKAGDIIRFRYTGARAEILEDYLDGSYAVWLLDDDEESIAFHDDFVPEAEFTGIENSPLAKKLNKPTYKKLSTEEMFFSKEELNKQKQQAFQKNSPTPTKEEEEIQEENIQFEVPIFRETAPTESGLSIAFIEQSPANYAIYLINDSHYALQFEFEFYLNQKRTHELKNRINSHQYFAVGEMQHANLNDNPKIILYLPSLNIQEDFKLKYKKWIKMQGQAPLIGSDCPHKLLIPTARITKIQLKQEETNNLKTYTHEQLKNQIKAEVISKYYNKNDVQRLAHFNHELDLHIEKLIEEDPSELTPAEIFEMQRLALDRYMQQAIELGVAEVFIIHGLGEGKLQRSVAKYLQKLERQNLIQEFKNEYLPKYGFGATHVRI